MIFSIKCYMLLVFYFVTASFARWYVYFLEIIGFFPLFLHLEFRCLSVGWLCFVLGKGFCG